MASTIKILVTVLLINLLLSVATIAYNVQEDINNGEDVYDSSIIGNYSSTYTGETYDQFRDDEQNSPTTDDNDFVEPTYGSRVGWGKLIFQSFKGIEYKPKTTGDNRAEKILVDLFNLFRALMVILLLVEALAFFMNKKT